ncbi:MAG: VOC family protein, partial [Hyphomonas sp.]
MAAALVPELYVSDLERSLDFYCGALGFSIVYQRPAERFAYIERGGAEL